MFNALKNFFDMFIPWLHGVRDIGEAFAAGAETVKLSAINYRDEQVIQNKSSIKTLTKQLETE